MSSSSLLTKPEDEETADAPVDRLGRPLYAFDDEDGDAVLYVPRNWPAIDIDRFGASRAYAYPVNHPEVLLDCALDEMVALDAGIKRLYSELSSGFDPETGIRHDQRAITRLGKDLQRKKLGFEGLICEVWNTMGSRAGAEFERRARQLTGRTPEPNIASDPTTTGEQPPPRAQLSFFN